MIHYGECRITLHAGLQVKPTKVVQGVVNMEAIASAGVSTTTPAPAQIIIKGKHINRVLQLLAMNKDSDADLAARFKAVKPELVGDKDDKALANDVRAMILDELMELRGD